MPTCDPVLPCSCPFTFSEIFLDAAESTSVFKLCTEFVDLLEFVRGNLVRFLCVSKTT